MFEVGKINSDLVKVFRSNFYSEVVNETSDLLRQGDRVSKHEFTEGGLIKEGIMNLHMLVSQFPESAASIRSILLSADVKNHLEKCYGKSFDLVGSMTFHANPSTSLHTDDIFLDSVPTGFLVGVLFSLEDFNEENGGIRFLDMSRDDIEELYMPIDEEVQFPSFDAMYEKRGEYLAALKSAAAGRSSQDVMIKKGEFVSWESYAPHETIRGSKDLEKSRFSIAAHYCPQDMEYGTRLKGNSRELSLRQKIQRLPV